LIISTLVTTSYYISLNYVLWRQNLKTELSIDKVRISENFKTRGMNSVGTLWSKCWLWVQSSHCYTL